MRFFVRLPLSLTVAALVLAGCGGDSSEPNPPPPTTPPTPTDLMALPGPGAGEITLTWLPSSGSAVFNVYRGTQPGVTTATGTRVGPVSNSYTDTGRAPGTYYYVVTQVNGTAESDASEETKVVFDDGIALGLRRPVLGGPGGDDLLVDITIASTFEVASATAQVADRQTALAVAPSSGTPPGWRGTLDLRGLPHARQRVSVSVTDVQGHHVEGSIPFRYDTPPALTVEAPRNYELARPDMHLKATCADDDPSGCTGINVDIVDDVGNPFQHLFFSAASPVDAQVSLASVQFGGRIRILATDKGGQSDTVYRTITRDTPAAAVQPVADVPGRIVDVTPDYILYDDSTAQGERLVRRDRAGGAEVTITTVSELGEAFLGPPGVVLYIQITGSYPYAELFEWRNGTSSDLGGVFEVRVAGGYAIWETGVAAPPFDSPLVRRDLTSGITIPIASAAGNVFQSVAADGDVAYWTSLSYEVWWSQDGTGGVNISPPGVRNTYPATDGTQVVYRRETDGTFPPGPWDVVHFDAGGETLLVTGRTSEPYPDQDYAVNNGWAAFTRPGSGGQLQIWTRSPAGQERQVTSFGVDSRLIALGPNGEIVYSSTAVSGFQYVAPPYTAAAVNVGTAGTIRWVGGQPLKWVGTGLFSITP